MKAKNNNCISNHASASFIVEQQQLNSQIRGWIKDPRTALPKLKDIYYQKYANDDNDFNSWLTNRVGDFDWISNWIVWADEAGNMHGFCTIRDFNYFEFFKLLDIIYSE